MPGVFITVVKIQIHHPSGVGKITIKLAIGELIPVGRINQSGRGERRRRNVLEAGGHLAGSLLVAFNQPIDLLAKLFGFLCVDLIEIKPQPGEGNLDKQKEGHAKKRMDELFEKRLLKTRLSWRVNNRSLKAF